MIEDGEVVASIPLEDADPTFVQFRDESRFWIQRILLPIVGVVGVFGNIATIVVLTRRGMRTSTNAYLTALAIADLIYLICVLWLSLRHYPGINENSFWNFIYSHVWPYSLWLTDATNNTSVWLTVTFTVERFIAIAYPIKRRVLCTVSRARKIIYTVYLICFTTTMTTPFEWTVEEKSDRVTNASVFEITSSSLGENKTYHTIYYWFTTITFVLLPLAMLIIFNSFLIHSLRQSQKLNRIMTARHKVSDREKRAANRDIKITSTLIVVVIMFLLCQLPTASTLVYNIFRVTQMTSNEEAILRALGNIFNFLVSVNASCNFILYCVLSEKYRRTFMLTFPWCFYWPSTSVHSRVVLSHQVEGPNGAQYTSSCHDESPLADVKMKRNVFPSNTAINNSSKLRRMPSAQFPSLRNPNCFIIALSENRYSSSDLQANQRVHQPQFSIPPPYL